MVGTAVLGGALALASLPTSGKGAAESRAKRGVLPTGTKLARPARKPPNARSGQQLTRPLLDKAGATVRGGECGQRVNALDAIHRHPPFRTPPVCEAWRGSAGLPVYASSGSCIRSEFTLRLVDPTFGHIALCRRAGPIEIRRILDSTFGHPAASTNLQTYYAEWTGWAPIWQSSAIYDSGERARQGAYGTASGPVLCCETLLSRDSFHPWLPRTACRTTHGEAVWDVELGAEVTGLVRGTPLVAIRAGWRAFAPVTAERELGRSDPSHCDGEMICFPEYRGLCPLVNGILRAVARRDRLWRRYSVDGCPTGEKRLLGRHKAQHTGGFAPMART